MDILEVNWLAIVLAALCGFLVGGIWYGPVMGKKWLGAVGLSEDEVNSGNMALIYGGAFILSLVSSAMLAHLFFRLGQPPFHVKMMMSTGIALTFIIPAIGTNYLFSRKSKTLFFIDAGYWLLFYIAMGLVHAWLS
ncbi:DUF1761 domain-containing protein [Parasphingorhabdus sp. JC815]|uniref:DUF1761 domain-containing protein n=1 Tax=Parasphingorhabdus sp. JC815 TaxID=3232140 RepID=UPI003458FDA8